jgi:hypothetical protein
VKRFSVALRPAFATRQQAKRPNSLRSRQDTPPERSRVTRYRWQISWLAGRRPRPPSQEHSISVTSLGRRLSAYSCGGSRGFASTTSKRTAFPFDPQREPPATTLARLAKPDKAKYPESLPECLLARGPIGVPRTFVRRIWKVFTTKSESDRMARSCVATWRNAHRQGD